MGFKIKRGSVLRNKQEQGSQVAGVKKKPKLKMNLARYLTLAIMIVVLVFVGRIFLVQRAELAALMEQKESLQQRIIDMQSEIVDLEDEAERLSDMAYIEQIARMEYGMVGVDDIVFIPAKAVKGQ